MSLTNKTKPLSKKEQAAKDEEFRTLLGKLSGLSDTELAQVREELEFLAGGVQLSVPNTSTSAPDMIAKPALEEAIARVGMEDALTAITEWEGRRNG